MSDTFYRMQTDRDGVGFVFGPFRIDLIRKLKKVALDHCGDEGENNQSRDRLPLDEVEELVDLTEKTPGEAEFQYLRWLFDYNELQAEAAAKELGIQITQPGGIQE